MRKMAVTLLAAVIAISLCACGKGSAPAADISTRWQEQYDLGVRYLSEGNYEEAIIAFSAAIEIDPKRAEAYVGRGDTYVLSGETEENLAAAQSDYETAIELDEANAAAYLGLADVYIRRGDFGSALTVIRRGLEHCPEDADLLNKKAELEAGEVMDSSGMLRCESSFDAQDNLMWYRTYSYTEDGKYSSIASFNAAGDQTGYVEFTYDVNGKTLHGENGYPLDTGIPTVADWIYDESGDVVGVTEYAADGAVSMKGTYQWNADRSERLYMEYGALGDLRTKCVTRYDTDGRRLSVSWQTPDGVAYNTGDYEYDGPSNRQARIVWHGEDGATTGIWVFHYDASGNPIGTDYLDANGNLLQSTVGE